MSQATVTSKGQVTIPKVIRQCLHLRSGDKVDFVMSATGEAVMRPVSKTAKDVFGLLAKQDRSRRSISDMDEAVKTSMRGAAR